MTFLALVVVGCVTEVEDGGSMRIRLDLPPGAARAVVLGTGSGVDPAPDPVRGERRRAALAVILPDTDQLFLLDIAADTIRALEQTPVPKGFRSGATAITDGVLLTGVDDEIDHGLRVLIERNGSGMVQVYSTPAVLAHLEARPAYAAELAERIDLRPIGSGQYFDLARGVRAVALAIAGPDGAPAAGWRLEGRSRVVAYLPRLGRDAVRDPIVVETLNRAHTAFVDAEAPSVDLLETLAGDRRALDVRLIRVSRAAIEPVRIAPLVNRGLKIATDGAEIWF